jgi:DNA repair exonuclease SbcCD nuclease subunit
MKKKKPGFIQTGDIHVGESRSLEDGYLERHASVFSQIISHCKKTGLPLIIAGDIFHFKKITNEERFLVDKFFADLEHEKIETIIISGNHDHLYGDFTSINGYALLPFKHLRFVDWSPRLLSLQIHDTLVDFICIPWRGYTEEQLKDIVEHHLLMCKGQHKVVVCHECILQAKFDNGFLAEKGTKLPDIPSVSYWAVGDIHVSQMTNLSNGWYAGSPLQFSFHDDPKKGFLEVDLNKPTEPKFIETKFKKLLTVSRLEEVKEDAHYMLKNSNADIVYAAQNDERIKAARWVKEEQDAISFQGMDVTSGLADFLAKQGLDSSQQIEGVEWVKKMLAIT